VCVRAYVRACVRACCTCIPRSRYTMTYLGWNFTQSMEWSRSICGNPPVYWNMLAAQWYCASLYEASQPGGSEDGKYLWLSDCANCAAFYENCEPPPAAETK
jgi:hypothetical protein